MARLKETGNGGDGKWNRLILLIAVVALSVGMAFWASDHRIAAGISIAEMRVGGMSRLQAYHALKKHLDPIFDRQITLTFPEGRLRISFQSIGMQPDYLGTVSQAYRVGRIGPVWRQAAIRWHTKRAGLKIQVQFKNDPKIWLAFYRLLKGTMEVEPRPATVRVSRDGTISYTKSQTGRLIDREAFMKRLEAAALDPTIPSVRVPMKKAAPSLTEAEIHSWSLDRVLGLYSTQFNPAMIDRTYNILMACSVLDNKLIYPGQSFSFNTWVGPRVPEAGYREAPVIFMGKLVAGIGGGVCQVSSTLYNAVLLANLKVLERFNHSLPCSYVPLARDATLVDGGLDFVFENNHRKPVLITARVESPYVIVAILGEKSDWEHVALETVLVRTFPTWVKEIPDPDLPSGERVKIAEGSLGAEAELWQTVTGKDGTIRRMKVNTSIYPAQPEEYKVGTKQLAGAVAD